MSLADFKVMKFLGRGSYGSVSKVLRRVDNSEYALKEVDIKNMSQREREEAVNEIRILASIHHPNVVSYCEAFCEHEKLYIVTEFANSGDLLGLIKRQKAKNQFFNEETIWRYFIQLCLGIRALHNKNILHRDLKSPNIFLCTGDILKIGDLGVAKLVKTRDRLTKTQVGTPYYVSPEVWKNLPYDAKCDIWSLGVLLYELATFRRPFEADSMKGLIQKVLAGRYTPIPTCYSRELQDLIKRMLVQDPISRPTINEILSMPCVARRIDATVSAIGSAMSTAGSGSLSPSTHRAASLADFTSARIRSTIRVPRNLKELHFPSPSYPTQPLFSRSPPSKDARSRECASRLIREYKEKWQNTLREGVAGGLMAAAGGGGGGVNLFGGPSGIDPNDHLPVLSPGRTTPPEKRSAPGDLEAARRRAPLGRLPNLPPGQLPPPAPKSTSVPSSRVGVSAAAAAPKPPPAPRPAVGGAYRRPVARY